MRNKRTRTFQLVVRAHSGGVDSLALCAQTAAAALQNAAQTDATWTEFAQSAGHLETYAEKVKALLADAYRHSILWEAQKSFMNKTSEKFTVDEIHGKTKKLKGARRSWSRSCRR